MSEDYHILSTFSRVLLIFTCYMPKSKWIGTTEQDQNAELHCAIIWSIGGEF
jgi:D-alanyl-D-alanine dipeptidase